jgi:integrase
MGSIRTLADRGTLFIDFRYEGKRCREYTALNDTPANRKRLQRALDKIEQDIVAGTFVYAESFPNSQGPKRSSGPLAGASNSSGRDASPAAPVGPTTPTFRDFADVWFKNHEVEWRRSHIKVLRSTLDGHLVPHFGNKPVGQITKADILDFRTRLSKLPGRRDAAALSNKRINGILGPLKQMLTEAAELYSFPCQVTTLKPLKIRKSDVEPFTLDQVQTLLATVRADYKDYFTVRLLTGMRTGEIHGLKWEYVDFDKRLILVRETFVLGEDEYTKTDGSQREIQMNQPVYDALKRQHEATSKVSDYVFCNREGQPLDNKNFTDRVWYPLLRHLGLKLRTPYQTRHTAATLWLASGEAPEWIARQLGHTSTAMLFKTYSCFVPNLTRQDGSAIDRLLASRFSTGKTRADDDGKSDRSATPPAQPPPASRSMRASVPIFA